MRLSAPPPVRSIIPRSLIVQATIPIAGRLNFSDVPSVPGRAKSLHEEAGGAWGGKTAFLARRVGESPPQRPLPAATVAGSYSRQRLGSCMNQPPWRRNDGPLARNVFDVRRGG